MERVTQRRSKKAVPGTGKAPVVNTVSNARIENKYTKSRSPHMEYAKILAHAVDTFGSRINANAWLNRPNRVFHNQTPLQILTEDPVAVEEELVRIDHGMFI